MSEDRLHQVRRGFADGTSQGDGPPDLGPLRALAEREELADATGRLADAYDRLYYLERAAQVQIYAMWTGQPLKQLPQTIVEKTKKEIGGAWFYEGPTPAERHLGALKRILDREQPDYAS